MVVTVCGAFVLCTGYGFCLQTWLTDGYGMFERGQILDYLYRYVEYRAKRLVVYFTRMWWFGLFRDVFLGIWSRLSGQW